MLRFFTQADRLLRAASAAPSQWHETMTLQRLVGFIFVFGIWYGAVMGSFGGVQGDRAWQLVYSAVKVPLLLMVTFALSLPSYFVANTLLGLRSDFGEVVRALVATQAGLTIVLASLAPFTAFWYVSSADYQMAVLFNLGMFAVASIAAQFLLAGFYRPLAARHKRHRWLMGLWIVVYAFVGVQMAWILRPFVGDPNAATQFFRDGSWGNAYVVVFRLLRDVFAN